MTSVFTTSCSGTPSDSADTAVPPCSTYSYVCSVKAMPFAFRNAVAADQVPDRLPRHAGSARGEKELVRSAFSLIQIARDPVDRLLTERYEALLGAFAHHAQNARVEVHLEGLQPDELRDPQARGVERLE